MKRARISLSLIGLGFLVGVTGCSQVSLEGELPLNSRYRDEQPALSGDGRWLAFVTNRNGKNEIAIYNLLERQFVHWDGLNSSSQIAASPSLSRTGRYVVYISSARGRSDIVLYDRATGRSEILTLGYHSWLRNPRISPNGRYIVFETSRRGQWDIEVLDRGPKIELDMADGPPLTVTSYQ